MTVNLLSCRVMHVDLLFERRDTVPAGDLERECDPRCLFLGSGETGSSERIGPERDRRSQPRG